MKKFVKKNIILTILSLVVAIFIAFFTYKLNLLLEEVSREKNFNKEAILEVIENVYEYRTPYTINYESLDSIYYTSYTCQDPLWDFDYSEKYPNQNLGSDNLHNPCVTYDSLSRMRNDFQRKTVKARVLGSESLNEALDSIEHGFDEVYEYYMTHDYYLRAFPDAYLEVMPPRFDNLIDIARQELR